MHLQAGEEKGMAERWIELWSPNDQNGFWIINFMNVMIYIEAKYVKQNIEKLLKDKTSEINN